MILLELENIKDPFRRYNYTHLLSKEGRKRYAKGWEIERLFGNSKEIYSIDNHRVRGLNRKFLFKNIIIYNRKGHCSIENYTILLQQPITT